MKKPISFGKYLLLERINVGGMAEVFMAKAYGAEGAERLLAIKKILPTMVEDEEFITMFLDEARISVQLNHPNVVQIHELGRQEENFYIAMDYVAGKDLRTILERYHRRSEIMPTAQAAFLAQRMAEGLDYAHKKKDARGMDLHIVHRDVSPQNILVSYDGEVKIIDFGIAKAANRAQKTQAGILKGKFGYMSPEQVRGLPIDRRSDIFALGVVLFEMLTGEKLFVGESDFSTLEKVRNADVPNIKQINSGIPSALEKVVYKALAREVEDRYQWAGEMAEDLARILGAQGYSEPQMSNFMKEAFREDVMREKAKVDSFAEFAPPGEKPQPPPSKSGPTRTPSKASSVSSRGSMPAAATAPVASRPAMPAARRGSAAAALDPVAAALAELDGGKPAAERPRTGPRVVEPEPPPEEGNGLDSAPTQFDPDNPFIPPPDEEELAQMDVSSDRTVMTGQAFDPDAAEAVVPPHASETSPGSPKLGMDTVIGMSADLVPPERETLLEDDIPKPAPVARGRPNSGPRKELRAPARPAEPPPDEMETRARAPEEESEESPEYGHGETGQMPGLEDPDAEGYGEDPQPEPFEDDAPEPTAASPNRRRRSAPAQVHDDVPELVPSGAHPRPKVGLIVGGSALGVVLFAGLAYLVYTLVTPAQATITVKVEPHSVDAVALIDNVKVPLDVPVPELDGDHLVALRMPGQPDQTEKVNLSRGHPREIHFQLQELAAKPAPSKPEAAQPPPEQKPAPAPEQKPAAVAADQKPPVPSPAPEQKPAPAPEQKPAAVAADQKPEVKAPEQPAEPKTFSLKIETDPPGATVLFGKQKGEAPLTVDNLDRKKSYTAEARMTGYKSPSVKVKFDGNDPMTVTVKLEKAPEHEAAATGESHESHEHKAAVKGSGTLICSSNPIAKVYVDGKNTNRYTPIPMSNPLKLSAGKHKVKFEDDASGKSATVDVTINPDETSRLLGVTLQ